MSEAEKRKRPRVPMRPEFDLVTLGDRQQVELVLRFRTTKGARPWDWDWSEVDFSAVADGHMVSAKVYGGVRDDEIVRFRPHANRF
jgi:hypothetical protein